MHITTKIALWILGVLLLLIGGTLLYLRNADLNVYESQIEGFLSDTVGHEVNVNGLFELSVGGLTRLTAEEIEVTNSDWPENPQLLDIGHVSVVVNTWSLISTPIIVESLELRDAQFKVEKDATNAGNWDAARIEATEPGEPDLHSIVFREVIMNNIQIAYDDAKRAEPLNVEISSLTVQPDSAGILNVDLQGAVDRYPLTADGKIGPWRNFVSGKDLLANMRLALGRIRLEINGSVADLRTLDGVEVDIDLQGPEIERVIEILELPQFASGEFHLDASIAKHDQGRQFELAGNLGEISIEADGTMDRLVRPEKTGAAIILSGPDARGVAEVFGIDGAPDVPFELSGDFNLDGQRLTFSEASAQLGENQFIANGWVDLAGNIPDVDVKIAASGPDISVVAPFIDVPGIPAEAFDISGRAQKSGRNIRLDGINAHIGEVQLNANGALGPAGGDDTEVFISLAGPDISIIESMTGLQGVPQRPFTASVYLRPDPIGINLDEARLTVGDNRLEIDGVIGTADGLTGTNISVHGFGPELHNVALLTGIPYLPGGKYDYKGQLVINNNIVAIEKFEFSVDGANASATGKADIGANTGDFDLSLAATSDDVSQLDLFESLKQLSGEQLEFRGRITNKNGIVGFHQISADIADLDISVDGTFNAVDSTGNVLLTVEAPDSEFLNSFIQDYKLPDGHINVSGQIAKMDGDIEFDHLSIELGDIHATANGTLSKDPLSNDSDLRFSIEGPDLSTLGEIFALNFMQPKAFRLAAEVNGTPTGFAIENIESNVGENEIVGEFAVNLSDKPDIKGSLSATYLDLASRLASMPDNADEAPVKEVSDSYLLPDDPLPLDFLKSINLDVDIQVGRLILSEFDVRDFRLGLAIDDGSLRIQPISFLESEGAIAGHLRLNPADDSYRLDTELDIRNIHLGRLSNPDEDRSQLPPLDGKVSIRGSGNSIHELMAASNGKISLRQGAGRTSGAITSRLFSDVIMQLLETLNPMQTADTHTNLECSFYDVSIVDGLATIDQLAIQTDKVIMAASGTVNLADEKLKLSMNAKPRKGFGISVGGIANSFFNIRGTLKNPALGIDTKGTVATTGAAIATGGLSLVAKGLWDRASSQESICKSAE